MNGTSDFTSRVLKMLCTYQKQVGEKTLAEEYSSDVLVKTAEILKTQPEFIVKTLKRFRGEVGEK